MNNPYSSRRQLLKGALGGAMTIGAVGWLAACSSDGSDSTATTGASGSTGSTGSTGTEPSSSAAPKKGGNLRVGLVGGGATDTLDPNVLLSIPDFVRAGLLYSGITRRELDYTVGFGIAEELSPVDTKGAVWDLRVRQGAEFHNGKTVGADDVIASFQRLLNADSPGYGAGQLSQLDPKNLKKMDDRTVRFTLNSPVSVLPELFSGALFYIVPADYDPTKPVGAGPFKYESFTAGDRSMFTRFDNFWGDVPHVDSVELIDLADTTAMTNALLAGQVDAIAQVPAAQVAQIEGAGFTTIKTSSTKFSPFYMRLDTAPFDDVRVRQAFRLIANREQMVQQVVSGRGSVGNDMYGRFEDSYPQDLPQREQDIEKAKALLAEAGKENLEVELVTGDAVPGWQESAQVFAEQAKAAGVTITVRSVDADTLFSQYYGKAAFGQENFPNWSYMDVSSQSTQATSPYNTTGINDEEYNALYNKALETLDKTARDEIISQMQGIEYDRGGYILWGWEDSVDAVAANVLGLESDTKASSSLNNYRLERVHFA